MRVYRKPNGGKASAPQLRHRLANGEIVIASTPTRSSCRTPWAARGRARESAVGAVAGNAKVGNRINIVTRWQAIEYVTSQNLDRRAFSLLEVHHGRPGAVGAWRKELVLAAGGFSEETLAEDQDLTLSIRRAGHAIVVRRRGDRLHRGARHAAHALAPAVPLELRHTAGGVEAA